VWHARREGQARVSHYDETPVHRPRHEKSHRRVLRRFCTHDFPSGISAEGHGRGHRENSLRRTQGQKNPSFRTRFFRTGLRHHGRATARLAGGVLSRERRGRRFPTSRQQFRARTEVRTEVRERSRFGKENPNQNIQRNPLSNKPVEW
jgi:hypothetical protein